MALSLSSYIWRDIENLESEKRMHLLQWQLQAREPIRRFSDMRAGDHLVRKSSFFGGSIQYEHHFLCVGFDFEEKPKIIHYYNTEENAHHQFSFASRTSVGSEGLNALRQMLAFSLVSGSALGQLGIVQEMTLPHEDFIKNEEELQAKGSEVERVVWPEEMRRYSVPEVIRRARERMGEDGEKFYHLTKNNCESFVMWCLCDLNISLQATPLRKALFEACNAFLKSIQHAIPQSGLKTLKKIADLACGTARGAFSQAQKALPKVGLGVGAAVTVLVEIIIAGIKIYNANEKCKSGVLIEFREKFIKEVIDSVLLALTRSGGCIAGMFVGELVIPIPFLGGALLGLLVGHIIGKVLPEISTEYLARLIESIIVKWSGV